MSQFNAAGPVKTIADRFQYCTFWLGNRLFGVDITDVKEVHPQADITPVYHAPENVKGYVNIRGQIHLILDLAKILGLGAQQAGGKCCLVIFKHTVAEPFGVIVDRIGDVVDVGEGQIERGRVDDKETQALEMRTELVRHICKLEKNLLVALNARRLLECVATNKEGN